MWWQGPQAALGAFLPTYVCPDPGRGDSGTVASSLGHLGPRQESSWLGSGVHSVVTGGPLAVQGWA